jgi:phage-related protein
VSEKPVSWLGSSLENLRAFPEDARRDAGYQLGRVQQGLLPTDWKPMTTVGPGVIEVRVHTRVEHRVFYIAKFEEAVYVLHGSRNGLGRRLNLRSRWPRSVSPICSVAVPRSRRPHDHEDSTFERQRLSRSRILS